MRYWTGCCYQNTVTIPNIVGGILLSCKKIAIQEVHLRFAGQPLTIARIADAPKEGLGDYF